MDLQEEFNKLDLQKSLLIGIVLAGLYYMMLFNDGTGILVQISNVKASIKENQAALAQVQQAIADQKKFDREIKVITQNMKDFESYFDPRGTTQNDLQAKISGFAEKHSLQVNEMKPAPKNSEFPNYKETAVVFKVEGPFHNVMEFISSLTKMDKVIDFNKMNFVITVPGDYPLVQLTTTLVVYSKMEGSEGTDETSG